MTLQWQKRTSSLTMPILLFCLITPCAGGRVQHFLNTVRKCLQSVGNTVTRAKYYSTAYNKAPRFSHKRSLALFCHFQGPFYFPPWSTTLQRQTPAPGTTMLLERRHKRRPIFKQMRKSHPYCSLVTLGHFGQTPTVSAPQKVRKESQRQGITIHAVSRGKAHVALFIPFIHIRSF